ncbi:MAG: Dam family site-specific DNA-(adenine-N6)-methyltransferase [Candidatus Marinimicrobia bacterium]|nr:Dam family site-specific DNA-(adenine-N6)-methyltransferase [Candidatus Neomarinimicrobiota bacterium]
MSRPLTIKPILRWAGGKSKIVQYLIDFLPDDIAERRYVEPFLGAASLFLTVQPENSIISDLNAHLMNCYKCVAEKPKLVYMYVRQHAARTNESYYYKVREVYNNSHFSAAQAARFIYLNKTCFNGIFRVNLKGVFNVPYGHKEPPALPTESHLIELSKLLARAQMMTGSYTEILSEAKQGDFFYLDPPYPPLNGTSFFQHYTPDRFSSADQQKLANKISEIDRAGSRFLLSNADIPLIRSLYRQYNIRNMNVRRWVSSKSIKHNVSELIITNY